MKDSKTQQKAPEIIHGGGQAHPRFKMPPERNGKSKMENGKDSGLTGPAVLEAIESAPVVEEKTKAKK